MGKGQLFLGTIRRKVGNIVGYKIANSNNAETQGVRVYQPNVANPQTATQLDQRIKLAAANNFYRGLEGLLDHSWQGIKYGSVSRQYFMKIALQKNSQYQLPYVTKGTIGFVPGIMPISRGSIAVNLPITIDNSEDWFDLVLPTLYFDNPNGSQELEGLTIREFSEIMAGSAQHNDWGVPGLKIGDQLTFVIVSYDEAGNFYPQYREFVLSDTDERNFVEASGLSGQIESNPQNSGSVLHLGWSNSQLSIAACAIIVSRYDEKGSKWLRNNEVLKVSDTTLARFMSSNAYEAAIESYKKNAAEVNSDWYLNQGSTENGSSGGFESNVTSRALSIAGNQQMLAYGAYGTGATSQGFIMKVAGSNKYYLAKVSGSVVTLYTGTAYNTGDISLGAYRRMLWDTARSRITNYTFVESESTFPYDNNEDGDEGPTPDEPLERP